MSHDPHAAGATRRGFLQSAGALGGGTNLIDLAKGGVVQPLLLVEVNRLPLADVTPLPDGGLRLGAMLRNSDAANHALIRTRYPLLSQALEAGASRRASWRASAPAASSTRRPRTASCWAASCGAWAWR